MRTAHPAAIALLATSVISCESGSSVDESSSARDSAGVTIVENTRPAWRAGDSWLVPETARVTIGVIGGDPAYELFRPRAAFRLSDGRIVIANTGTQQVRYYAESGRHIMSVGGRGGGPGEFRRVDRVFRVQDDSVVVYDQTQRRITVFDPDGNHV